jgi:chemotaxis methyl-accepting protein methylase
MIYRRALRRLTRGIWTRLPESLRVSWPGQAYGRLLNASVRRQAERTQYFGTFFLRNRPELELMRRLVSGSASGSSLNIAVLACSKGAEVYSILWTLRSAHPNLQLTVNAVDISQEILEFARRGVYSRHDAVTLKTHADASVSEGRYAIHNTWKDQGASIFQRLTDEEMAAMFELNSDLAKIKPWLREGTTWLCGDASDPQLAEVLNHPDIVVANRFLCHMEPAAAERCLLNVARLVKPGGYLFVSGIDLDVRTKVAQDMGWKPVTDLMKEIHEGDRSLRESWPLEYWGLEPFSDDRPDWKIRYASVFQIGENDESAASPK